MILPLPLDCHEVSLSKDRVKGLQNKPYPMILAVGYKHGRFNDYSVFRKLSNVISDQNN